MSYMRLLLTRKDWQRTWAWSYMILGSACWYMLSAEESCVSFSFVFGFPIDNRRMFLLPRRRCVCASWYARVSKGACIF